MSNAPINLRALLPLVLPYAPNCPDMVATFNLRMAAIEFCGRTLCWRQPITTTIAAATPPITLPLYSEIVAYEYAMFEGRRLDPITLIDAEQMGLDDLGTPRYIVQETPNTLRVMPYAPGALKISVFLKPAMGNIYAPDAVGQIENSYDRVPTFMFMNHAEALAAGALARLYAQPAAEYANIELAMGYAAKFERAVGDAMGKSLIGQQRAPIRSKTTWC